jgi:hypothetical protein
MVEPTTGAFQLTDWGWASHTGLFTNEGTGILNLATGEFLSGSGVLVAADGDELHWELAGVPNFVSYTGGTGRFTGATGGFPAVITSQELLSVNGDGTWTLAVTYIGTGTITY